MARAPEPLATRLGAGPIWTAVYAAVALAAVVFAVVMHVGEGHGLTTPQVLFPSVGALWFAFRAYFAFTAKR